MASAKTVRESIAEIKTKYPTHTLGFIEFFDGDREGRMYAYNLHRILLSEEGYDASLTKLEMNTGSLNVSTNLGTVEIGDLDSGIKDFDAFHVRIYPGRLPT